VRWYQERLVVPPMVRQATTIYRDQMNPLRGFIPDVCVLESGSSISSAEFRQKYEGWAREQGIRRPLGGKALGGRLRDLGCKPYSNGQERGWRGIRMRSVLDTDGMTESDSSSETRLYTRAYEESSGTDVSSVIPSGKDQEQLPTWVTEDEP